MVDLQALADRLRLVVLALDERGAVDVAATVLLGRVEVDVVDAPALRDATPGQPADDLVVGGLDEEHGRQRAPVLVERGLERLALGDRAREAVEQEAVGASGRATASRITPMMT